MQGPAGRVDAPEPLRPVPRPADTPEPGYRPSTGLAEDSSGCAVSTCAVPNCVAAQFCDIDHAIAGGRPRRLRCLCRKHRCSRPSGPGPQRTDTQSPDADPLDVTDRRSTVAGSRLVAGLEHHRHADHRPHSRQAGTGLARSRNNPCLRQQADSLGAPSASSANAPSATTVTGQGLLPFWSRPVAPDCWSGALYKVATEKPMGSEPTDPATWPLIQ